MQIHCWLVLALTCGSASAASLSTVEVKGSRHDQRRDETAGTVVLGRAQLAADGDRTLAEALQRLPGITVDTSGRGATIRMRGLGSGYTQVLLNGVPAPAGFTVDTLAPELVERVEILRAGSAELGTQGIAGTVNIVLRKVPARPRQEYGASVEWLDGRLAPRASAQWSGKADRLTWLASLNAMRSVLPQPQLLRERLPAGERALAIDNLNVADSVSLAPRLTWRPTEADTLTWQGFAGMTWRDIAAAGRELPGASAPGQFAAQDSRFRSRAPLLRGDLTWQRQLPDGATLELTAGASHSPRTSDFDFAGRTSASAQPTRRYVQADIGDDVLLSKGRYGAAPQAGHTVVAGWDVSLAKRHQTRVERELGPDGTLAFVLDQRYDGRVERRALYVQDDWQRGAWSLSAGLRHETLDTAVAGADARSRLWSPVLQAAVKLTPATTLRSGISRTFKTPTMVELVPRRYTTDNNNSVTNPDTEGNPALRPELAWGFDAGIDRYLDGGGLLSASAYSRRIDDVTVQQLSRVDERWLARPVNAGRATVHGIALEAKLALSAALTVRANVARNWSRVAALPGPDNRLDRQAPTSGSLGVEYRAGAMALGTNYLYQGGVAARTAAMLLDRTAPQRKLDAWATWQLDTGRRLRIDALNLLHPQGLTQRQYGPDDHGLWQDAATRTRTYRTLRVGFELQQ
ncbi:TonB-dependent receptor plug domain-containing protein [Pseudoduganella chitinolytica]|uniref:TonB-dependent receptor n=1 Tax=Pseudoduganella chitinolytica TaxID=34070 RepID=A0ABY8B9Q7_9BURK|nr:TonB-dependent receptor [Pseudoduganella chitinolytica]WEF31723.1 TonB-dependent receptor [Pseudoduganella chitinolytica]